ncbi:hypothetical protein [Mycolicibacterium komossense]|uniref:Uncharacterized protein n=1 Tax=Mycolicibacterium komossense TaxID=1779 RepID=A0ABT3CGW1_9MYCO|nr:hypothetical protein [Mycolicibacterium komossense]MCV7228730.1 hypothetical protein [Mycolicibacterium komossense]
MTWRWMVSVLVAAACFALLPAGLARADCTVAGDFGAGSGCPPPGGSSDSGGGDSWPPTAVDWPPGADSGSDGGSGGGAAASPSTAPTPIVLPLGQEAPATSISETPTPIVPVGAPPLH